MSRLCTIPGAFFLTWMVTLAPSFPAQAAGPWGDLAVWENHYPFDNIPGMGKDFFASPRLSETLHEILAPSDRRLLKSYGVSSTIASVAGYEVLNVCAAHDCPAENATIIIDKAAPSMWVVFFAHRGPVVSVRWYGTDDYEHLPQDILNQVLWGHEPKP